MLDCWLCLRGSFLSEVYYCCSALLPSSLLVPSYSFEFSGFAAGLACFFFTSPGPTTTYVLWTLLISINELGASLDADLFLFPPFLG
jgi:hypothetical protein